MRETRMTKRPVRRCEAEARRGTGYGTCDAPLDNHGVCPRAGTHAE